MFVSFKVHEYRQVSHENQCYYAQDYISIAYNLIKMSKVWPRRGDKGVCHHYNYDQTAKCGKQAAQKTNKLCHPIVHIFPPIQTKPNIL